MERVPSGTVGTDRHLPGLGCQHCRGPRAAHLDPLRQKLGIGKISNVLIIGTGADAAPWMLPTLAGLPPRFALPLGAVLLNGGAAAAYIGAGLGPGTRDGLPTGGVRLTGWPVRWVRMGSKA